MTIIFILIFAGLLIYDGYVLYTQYRASTSTGWQRYLDAAEGSATILWARFSRLVAALAALIAMVPDYLGDPALSQEIKANLKPEYVVLFVVGVQAITIWARKRTL